MNDQPTGPALYRAACEVMGYEVEDDVMVSGYFWPQTVVRTGDTDVMLHDHWNIMRLIVEWIEARGCDMINWDKSSQTLAVHCQSGDEWIMVSSGKSLPEAAARWVVEHGRPKIKEASPMNPTSKDFLIQTTSDALDVANHELRSMPVGGLDWRMKRQQVKALEERLHRLRIEGMTGP